MRFEELDPEVHGVILADMIEECLSSILDQIRALYGLEISPPGGLSVREYAEGSVDELAHPGNFCYLVEENGDYIGMGAIREIGRGTGEIKRMYVRPRHRGRGIGRTLLRRLLEKGAELGYRKVCLDTGRFMEAARNLYRSAGFVERGEYPGTEVPPEIRDFWLYMERDL